MRKRSRIALTLLLLAVLGGIVWLALPPNEPMYEGKRLNAWLELYDLKGITFFGPETGDRYAAPNEAVRQIGTNAIPILLRRLQAKDSPLTQKLVALIRKQNLFKVTFRPARVLQREGVSGFYAMGAAGKDAVPELLKMYEQNRFVGSQDLAASALGGIGPAAAEAVPMLVRSLSDTKSASWYSTIVALGRIHARPEIAVPALVQFFSDQEGAKRWNAVEAIGAFGSDARQAVPDLLGLIAGTDTIISEAAMDSLKKIDPELSAKLLLPGLIKQLGDQDNEIGRTAAHDLFFYRSDARQAVLDLLKLLDDSNPSMNKTVKEALKKIDPEAPAKVEAK